MVDPSGTDATPNSTLRSVLKSQYHAALAMLREPIERCPASLWDDPTPTNRFWQVAYHTLFFTHFYLMPEEAAFQPWAEHVADVQDPDGIAGPPRPDDPRPVIPDAYSREQVLRYWDVVDGMVDDAVDALDLAQPTSGFPWYRMSKLEHQFVNLRHTQHHAAQLADRLRAAADLGTRWVGGKPSS